MDENIVFIDGDFPSGKGNCSYHCSPTCHPMQVGPDWKFGCTHPSWPQNREGDFCPIVECGGEQIKCAFKEGTRSKYLKNYIVGRKARIRNALWKVAAWKNEIRETEILLGKMQ